MDDADHRRKRPSLPEYIHAEASQLGNREGKIVVESLLEVGAVTPADLIDRVHQLPDHIGKKHIPRQALLMSAALEGDRKTGDQKDIRRVRVDCLL